MTVTVSTACIQDARSLSQPKFVVRVRRITHLIAGSLAEYIVEID